ncbi:MAG: hypothetical protein JO100_17555 [Pseudonocardia sp.]|nr:hypothetical protein [Pseudonocardia sp.]
MTVPKEYRALFSRWCAERVPAHARAHLQIGFRIHGDVVTILERRPPEFPELSSVWTSTSVAQLRHNDPEPGLWRIYHWVEDSWRCYDHPPSTMPEPLLAMIAADPDKVF